jgi:HAD superfamily hydrolase (TIGR01509 family)
MDPPVFPATIFDFNGVLVDDEEVHRDAFRDVLGPLGVRFSDETYVERYLGFDDIGAIRAMLADAGRAADDAEVQALADRKRPFYMRRAEGGLVIFEGAAEVLKRRAAEGPVAIVSGALRDEIAFALRRMGLEGSVGTIISAEDTPRCKPDPMGYELGIAALAASIGPKAARRAVVIEDSLAGIESAKAAGLTCVAVAHSYPEARLREVGADAVVPRIADVDDALLAELHLRTGGHG